MPRPVNSNCTRTRAHRGTARARQRNSRPQPSSAYGTTQRNVAHLLQRDFLAASSAAPPRRCTRAPGRGSQLDAAEVAHHGSNVSSPVGAPSEWPAGRYAGSRHRWRPTGRRPKCQHTWSRRVLRAAIAHGAGGGRRHRCTQPMKRLFLTIFRGGQVGEGSGTAYCVSARAQFSGHADQPSR